MRERNQTERVERAGERKKEALAPVAGHRSMAYDPRETLRVQPSQFTPKSYTVVREPRTVNEPRPRTDRQLRVGSAKIFSRFLAKPVPFSQRSCKERKKIRVAPHRGMYVYTSVIL